jgi:hypothetical protein
MHILLDRTFYKAILRQIWGTSGQIHKIFSQGRSMKLQLRMVKPGWEHPDKALLQGSYEAACAKWETANAKWKEGFEQDYGTPRARMAESVGQVAWVPKSAKYGHMDYSEYSGSHRPKRDDYMPTWSPEEATLFVMYDAFWENKPVSPPFETPEQLAVWLNASQEGEHLSTVEWLSIIHSQIPANYGASTRDLTREQVLTMLKNVLTTENGHHSELLFGLLIESLDEGRTDLLNLIGVEQIITYRMKSC